MLCAALDAIDCKPIQTGTREGTDHSSVLQLAQLPRATTALGMINHMLLSLAASRAAYLDIRGVILVGKPNAENRNAIEHYGQIHPGVLVEFFHGNFDSKAFGK